MVRDLADGQTRGVDITAEVELPASVEQVRRLICDLDRYPAWLSIVERAEQVAIEPAAWAVELRARVGPLARSKRLRMVRTLDEAGHLRFERSEQDARRHSPWTLDAHLSPTETGTCLVMVLHYGGGFGGGVVERLLGDEIERSKERLRSLLEADAASS